MTLQSQLASLATAIGGDIKAQNLKIGTLASLTTTAKTDLVAAINELKAGLTSATSGGVTIADGGTATTSTWSSSKINSTITTATAAVKTDILGGATAAYDTLQELKTLLDSGDAADQTAITSLTTAVGNRVRFDAASSLTAAQQLQARTNIGAQEAAVIGNADADLVAVYNTAKA